MSKFFTLRRKKDRAPVVPPELAETDAEDIRGAKGEEATQLARALLHRVHVESHRLHMLRCWYLPSLTQIGVLSAPEVQQMCEALDRVMRATASLLAEAECWLPAGSCEDTAPVSSNEDRRGSNSGPQRSPEPPHKAPDPAAGQVPDAEEQTMTPEEAVSALIAGFHAMISDGGVEALVNFARVRHSLKLKEDNHYLRVHERAASRRAGGGGGAYEFRALLDAPLMHCSYYMATLRNLRRVLRAAAAVVAAAATLEASGSARSVLQRSPSRISEDEATPIGSPRISTRKRGNSISSRLSAVFESKKESSGRSSPSTSRGASPAPSPRARSNSVEVDASAPVYAGKQAPWLLAGNQARRVSLERGGGGGEGGAVDPKMQKVAVKVNSCKVFFKEHYQDVLVRAAQRQTRFKALLQSMRADGSALDEDAAALAQHVEQESQRIHARRVRPRLRDFDILGQIGQGAFGHVFLCRKNDAPDEGVMVMKKIKKAVLIERNMVDTVRVESEVLKAGGETSSPWLVTLRYSFQDKNNVYLCMEYVPGGDFSSLLANIEFSEEDARVYAAEMIMSVSELHRLGFIHRDLKPDNFLINAQGHLVLADFGLSKGGVSGGHIANLHNLAPLRVFVNDGTYKTIGVKAETTVAELTRTLLQKLNVPADEHAQWLLFESSLQRTMEGDTAVREKGLRPDDRVVVLAEKWAEEEEAAAASGDLDAALSRFVFKRLGELPPENAVAAMLASGGNGGGRAGGNGGGGDSGTPKRAKVGDSNSVRMKSQMSFKAMREHLAARREKNKVIARSVVGTPYYMAPEMLRQEGYTHTVDCWSVGCLIYEMITGVPPFTGDSAEEVFEAILDYEHTLRFPDSDDDVEMSETCRDLIRKTLCGGDKRLNFAEMKKHEWFRDVDFDRLHEVTPPFVPQLQGDTDMSYFEDANNDDEIMMSVRVASDSDSQKPTVSREGSEPEFPAFMLTAYAAR